MIRNILNSKLIKGSKVLGIDYYINTDGNIDLNCVILSQKKGKVSIEKKFTGVKDLDQLNDSELKDLPVVLSIDGKGVLFRIIEKSKNQKLIHHILPNAKEEDFVLQSSLAFDNKIIISAIRKEILKGILDSLNELGFQIIKLFIGPLAIENITAFIEQDNFYTNRYQILLNSNLVTEIQKLPESKISSIQIGDDEIYSEELTAYASALGFYLPDSEEDTIDAINESKNEFLYKRSFTLAGWFTLAFFFTLLMVNYMFYNKNNKKLNQLTFSYNQNRELLKKLDTLKNEFLIKEQYFVNSGFLDASRLSYFADRIANSLPKNIKLSGMDIIPLNTKIKDEKPIGFSMNSINIIGTVNQSIVLNNWVKKLKKFDWVRNVNIVEYNQEIAETPANFEIVIDLE